MGLDLDAIVLVKPEAYEKIDKPAAERYFEAEQRVLSALEKGLICKGEEQLKAKKGYTSKNRPDESPKRSSFSLDGIKFDLITNVKVNNPPYQSAFDKITGFLEVLVNDWEHGVRKDGVRTYKGEIKDKEPFVRWDYLMWNALWYLSNMTELGVENKFEKITAPRELDEMDLERLVIPKDLIKELDIEKPSTAKVWYLAKRFYKDVMAKTVTPVKEEMVKRSAVTKEEIPAKTAQYLEQIGKYLYELKSIPSPRRQPGQVIKRLFLIPEKRKPKGSTALPVIPGPENYVKLLESYRDMLPISLKRWKDLDGHIGELIVFYYGIENHPRVQGEFPYLLEYQLKRDGDKMFISVQALYNRMKALEKDYVANRLLRKHSIVPIV